MALRMAMFQQLDDVAIMGDNRHRQGDRRRRARAWASSSSHTFSLLFSPNRPRGQATSTAIMTMKA